MTADKDVACLADDHQASASGWEMTFPRHER